MKVAPLLDQNHPHTAQQYNPYQLPPNWQFAQNHARSNMPGFQPQSRQCQKCPCCNNFINKKQIPYCIDVAQLGFLGQGIPLFYHFLKFCIIILVVLILDSAAVNILLNVKQNYCFFRRHIDLFAPTRMLQNDIDPTPDYSTPISIPPQNTDDDCVKNYANSLAYINPEKSSQVRDALRIVGSIGVYLILVYFRYQQLQILQQYESKVKISDFTLRITNIPYCCKFYKCRIKNMIRLIDKQAEVIDVLFVSKLTTYFQEQDKIHIKFSQYKKVIEQSSKIDGINLNFKQININTKFTYTQQVIQKFQQRFSGVVFVTLRTPLQKIRLIQRINSADAQIFSCCFCNCRLQGFLRIYAQCARQPLQIIWINIHYSKSQRIISVIFWWCVFYLFLFCLVVIFFFLFKLKQILIIQIIYKLEHLDCICNLTKYTYLKNLIVAYGYILVAIIIIINMLVIPQVAYYLTTKQRHNNYTTFQYSYACKYLYSIFTTTALMIFIFQTVFLSKHYTELFGLVQQATFMFICNSIFLSFLWLINPYHIVKYFKRRMYFNVATNFFQKQANQIMQFPNYSMGKRYAQVLNTMWFTFLFYQLIPIGAVFSVAGLILYYFVDKYILLRRSCLNQQISGQLTLQMTSKLQIILILKPLGQIIFGLLLRKQVNIVQIVFLILGVAYILFPLKLVFRYFFPQKNCNVTKKFQCFTFIQTYCSTYPLYRYQSKYWQNCFGLRTIQKKCFQSCSVDLKVKQTKYKQIIKQNICSINQIAQTGNCSFNQQQRMVKFTQKQQKQVFRSSIVNQRMEDSSIYNNNFEKKIVVAESVRQLNNPIMDIYNQQQIHTNRQLFRSNVN